LSTINLEPVRTSAIREIAANPPWRLGEAVERAAGCCLLAITGPITFTAALAVAVLSGRSPLVAHLRVGKDDEPFWMWKLRTMWDENNAVSQRRAWIEYVNAEPTKDGKEAMDPRVTSRFAAFCRRHSIDELPQLWHVAGGKMSLVGPRPLTRGEVSRHFGAKASELLSVKPGLTGLWQVSGRSAIGFPQRAALDLELVRTLTPRLYLTILLRTVSALIYGKGAW
jgi:exopolysaccharide production protein ExoY